ncbi:MAG: long-chain fatty acid--CoA ligase [Alphaproteobacteria bacterium]|nr:long-chain fatty acid--CoA ligase [Alphaproteobacteria bacterium]
MAGQTDYGACPNLARMFFDRAGERGSRPFLWAKRDGAYRPVAWAEAIRQVSALSRGLRALGVGRGDRVCLVSENRPEWILADIAIMAAGAITVPAYTTNTPADHRHILTNSGAKAAIVSKPALAERLLTAAIEAPALTHVVCLEMPANITQGRPSVLSWDEVVARGEKTPDDTAKIVDAIARTDTACIIYTSGTGGVPKGVMLSHGAILHNCKGAFRLLLELGLTDEVFLSFLPLSHSYEHTAGAHFPVSIGAQVYYAEGVDTLVANMGETKPTIMTAVPRLYESMHARIMRDVTRNGGLKEKLFMKTVELGRKRYEAGGRLGLIDGLVDSVLERLVRDKVRARFGGRLKAFVSGGGPLNVEIGKFFNALGVNLLQGYGLTETAPVVSCNLPKKVKIHTVGPPVVDTEVRIAEDGEILVRGELVMQGYWGDAEATAAVLKDGWLHTGDIGVIDSDGYIQITDRKKDIIVNSGGDNISPQRIEGFLTMQPEIGQAMVYGDKHPHLVGLIVPNKDFADQWAKKYGKSADLTALSQDTQFQAAVYQAVERVNKDMSVIERVRRIILAAEPFTVENGMMTPTLKIRRHKIREKYGEALKRLYG